MRVALDKLFANAVGDVAEIEVARLLLHLRVEHHLHEQVAELLGHKLLIIFVDGLYDLVGLFDKILFYAHMSLLGIPRAAARSAKQTHNLKEIVYIIFFFLIKVYHIIPCPFLSAGNILTQKLAFFKYFCNFFTRR